MNDSYGFGAGGFSQTQGNEGKADSKAEGVLPVVIKQLNLHTEDVLNMFGMEYKMITVVAVVRNIEHSTTKITYELEDLTGTIPGHYWIEENDSQQKNIQLNTYVRVVGALRAMGGTKSIMVFNIHPVSGINEVNTHLLEVINARYLAEEYSKGGAAKATDLNAPTKMEVETAMPDELDGLKGKDRAILDVIRTCNDESGCNRTELTRRFPNIPAREISQILESMINNGHIYTTLDQDHFQACF